jgi:hypothetical protein
MFTFSLPCFPCSWLNYNIDGLSKIILEINSYKFDYTLFYFVTMVFSACCLLFLVYMFFEILDYILYYKTKVDKEKEVLFYENQQLKKESLRQVNINKKSQKKIKMLQKELRQSYD